MSMKRLSLLLVTLLGLVVIGCGERATRLESADRALPQQWSQSYLLADRALHDAALVAALQQRLAAPPAYALDDPESWAMVATAYESNGHALLWLDDARPRAQLAQLRTAIANSAADGLDPARYDTTAVDALRPVKFGLLGKRYEPAPAADTDVRLTFAAVQLVRHLRSGRVMPEQIDKHWFDATPRNLGATVAAAARSNDVEAALRTLAPQQPQYARLRHALSRYRELATRGAWPQIPDTLKVKAGESSPDILALRVRLAASGHLQSAVGDNMLDPALQEAVRHFQREHGLDDDGVPGKSTIAALNVPMASRIRQLELSLERWRWLPEDLGDTHVLVNVPTYQLTAVEDGQPALQMRVVTGTGRTPTPIFHDTMETVVLSPYWNVPRSILTGEVIPGLNKDPSYLARKGMEVVRNGQPVNMASVSLSDPGVRVRQRPGASNSLGLVKFLFPNEYNVYLHDTPADALFARSSRAFSHGCVRLEKPFEFAQWVLKNNPEWTPEKIHDGMNSGRETHVRLERSIPVYIVYQTAWVDDDGTVRFADDIYGHDERQASLLPQSIRPVLNAADAMVAN